jgi:hypothetical protein
MSIFIATFLIIGIAIMGMAVGILLGRPAIKGSCGGLNQVGLSGSCGGVCSAVKKKACAKQRQVQLENSGS